MIYDVFISYSHQDSEVANELCALLVSAGVSYYIDSDRIDGGSYFSDSIANAISHCKVFLLLVSQNSMKSEYVNKELHYFVHHKLPTASLVPYRLDNSILKNDWDLVLSDVHYRRMSKEPMAPYLIHDILVCLKQPVPVQFAIHEHTQPDKLKWKYRGGGVDVLTTSDNADGEQLERAEIISGVDVVDVETKEKKRRGVKSWPLWLNILCCSIVLLIVVIVGVIFVNMLRPIPSDGPNINDGSIRLDSIFEEADRCRSLGKIDRAVELYNELYDIDSIRVLYSLGRCYRYESYEGHNDSIAVSYFIRAAAGDSAHGYYELARCYMKGIAVPPDSTLAFDQFKVAAKMGHIEAMEMLSVCYKHGYGTEVIDDASRYWAVRADSLRQIDKLSVQSVPSNQLKEL